MGKAKRQSNHARLGALGSKKSVASPHVKRREDAQEGISKASYTAISELGYELCAGDAVLPIVLKSEDGKNLSVIGTGFFVAPDIILTAHHIFENQDPRRMACMHILNAGNAYIFREFSQVVPHHTSDMALCMLHPKINSRHKINLKNHALLIGGPFPSIGTKLTTYAYPDVSERRYKSVLHMSIAPHHYDGEVLDIFPLKRDSVMINFPCMRTSIHLHGGASGGPVINAATGTVVGVNTSSFSGATNESYVALINPIIDMQFPILRGAKDIPSLTTLRELSLQGAARVAPENVLMRTQTVMVKIA